MSLADDGQKPRLEAALRYARAGIPVLPVRVSEEENGRYKKKPLIRDWPNQASTDPRKINPWWHRWPDASIGIVCGERSGLLVVDEDRPGALEELPGELPEPDTVLAASTSRDTPHTGLDLNYRFGVGPHQLHPAL